jgi:hypothetical protein
VTSPDRQSEGALLDMDAVQAAVVAVDAHFPTSAAYGLLGESMEDGIRAFLAAQDRDALIEAMVAPDHFIDKAYARAVARPMLDALLGEP